MSEPETTSPPRAPNETSRREPPSPEPQPTSAVPAGSDGSPTPGAESKPIRFCLVQPAQPKYRIPVFRDLASRPGIDLRVIYAEEPGLPNAEAEGYSAEFR